MVASTYTMMNASQPSGIAISQHMTTPVRKKPVKKRIFMPCTSAMEPSSGISTAMTSDAMVCA